MSAANEARGEARTRRRPGGPPPGPGYVEKPKDFKGTMSRLLEALGSYKALAVLVLVFAMASTVFNIIGPKVLSTATTEVFNGLVAKVGGTGGIDFPAIGAILATTLAIYLVSAACSFVQSWTMSTISQKTCYDLRRRIDQKIDRMPMGYFERTSTGDVLSRITNDVDTLGQNLNQGVTQLITSVTTIVGVLAMMFFISPLLTVVTLVVLPVSAMFVRLIVGKSQKHFKTQQEQLGAINGMVEETFSGHAVVRAFNRQDAAQASFDATNERLYEAAWKSNFISSLMVPIMTFIGNAGYAVVAVLGGALAASGAITVGDIQAFIQYVKNFTQPISQLSQVANVFQTMAAAAERIFGFLDEDEIVEAPGATDALPQASRGAVEFRHVRFGYRADAPVISDFSAKVAPGQTVALVGPTGAGKTTMVKLLMRFYDVDAGAILLDGRDVREYTRRALRTQVSMVLQDTWLFSGTIRENIRYGKLDATDAEVEAAAKAACAYHFIQTQPQGFDTLVDEAASNLSLGQRQLITIARAILADRPMLILDEATSSVDTRTEQLIQAAMDNLMRGRTSFVIAHRLSTIRHADLILCIDHGDIVEQGTHEELLAKGGFYARLYASQF